MLSSKHLATILDLDLTFFRTSLMKFYLNSQRMSDSFYHITESSRLYLKKDEGPKHTHLAMFWIFCIG